MNHQYIGSANRSTTPFGAGKPTKRKTQHETSNENKPSTPVTESAAIRVNENADAVKAIPEPDSKKSRFHVRISGPEELVFE